MSNTEQKAETGLCWSVPAGYWSTPCRQAGKIASTGQRGMHRGFGTGMLVQSLHRLGSITYVLAASELLIAFLGHTGRQASHETHF